jgi:aminopeptidase
LPNLQFQDILNKESLKSQWFGCLLMMNHFLNESAGLRNFITKYPSYQRHLDSIHDQTKIKIFFVEQAGVGIINRKYSGDLYMNPLQKAAQIAVKDCMAVKPDETVLIVTDPPKRAIAQALFEAALEYGKEAYLLEMKERSINGEEPPAEVTEMMKLVKVVLCPTSKSLTHTTARREACQAGARVGTLPGITRQMMIRTMSADYHQIAELTYQVSEVLTKGEMAHLTTPLGTDIRIPIKGIKAISSTGLITKPGTFGNLPSGESYLMPEEGKSQGTFWVDGSMAGIGKIKSQPIKITVENGLVVDVQGGREAKKLNQMIQKIGEKARNLAELGVGTNYLATITGLILEDEKVAGTVHLALGNNTSMGGTVNVGFHVDGIITHPTLLIDDFVLLADGKLQVK